MLRNEESCAIWDGIENTSLVYRVEIRRGKVEEYCNLFMSTMYT